MHGKIKERLELFREDISFLTPSEQNKILGENALKLWPDLN